MATRVDEGMDKAVNTGRYQSDYIMVKRRYWNSIHNAKKYLEADADSDHNPVSVGFESSRRKSPRQKEENVGTWRN